VVTADLGAKVARRRKDCAAGVRAIARRRARRLYEQGADARRLRECVLRWRRWLMGGLDGMVSRKEGVRRIERSVLRSLGVILGIKPDKFH
jgi:hypothetical protein